MRNHIGETNKKVDLRKQARDKPCMVRLPGCDGGGATTVLAHYRLANYCGTSLKPIDELGAWACAHCHDVVDSRIKVSLALAGRALTHDEIRLAHAEGVLRTIAERAKL